MASGETIVRCVQNAQEAREGYFECIKRDHSEWSDDEINQSIDKYIELGILRFLENGMMIWNELKMPAKLTLD